MSVFIEFVDKIPLPSKPQSPEFLLLPLHNIPSNAESDGAPIGHTLKGMLHVGSR